MKKSKYFSCKERDYTAYNCPRKEKIAAILEGISKDSKIQEKE